MHDFRCTNADDMNFDLLADRTRYYKEDPEGVSEMCKVMEDMRNEAAKAGSDSRAIEIAKAMLLRGKDSYEEIASLTKLSIDVIKNLASPKAQ